MSNFIRLPAWTFLLLGFLLPLNLYADVLEDEAAVEVEQVEEFEESDEWQARVEDLRRQVAESEGREQLESEQVEETQVSNIPFNVAFFGDLAPGYTYNRKNLGAGPSETSSDVTGSGSTIGINVSRRLSEDSDLKALMHVEWFVGFGSDASFDGYLAYVALESSGQQIALGNQLDPLFKVVAEPLAVFYDQRFAVPFGYWGLDNVDTTGVYLAFPGELARRGLAVPGIGAAELSFFAANSYGDYGNDPNPENVSNMLTYSTTIGDPETAGLTISVGVQADGRIGHTNVDDSTDNIRNHVDAAVVALQMNTKRFQLGFALRRENRGAYTTGFIAEGDFGLSFNEYTSCFTHTSLGTNAPVACSGPITSASNDYALSTNTLHADDYTKEWLGGAVGLWMTDALYFSIGYQTTRLRLEDVRLVKRAASGVTAGDVALTSAQLATLAFPDESLPNKTADGHTVDSVIAYHVPNNGPVFRLGYSRYDDGGAFDYGFYQHTFIVEQTLLDGFSAYIQLSKRRHTEGYLKGYDYESASVGFRYFFEVSAEVAPNVQ